MARRGRLYRRRALQAVKDADVTRGQDSMPVCSGTCGRRARSRCFDDCLVAIAAPFQVEAHGTELP